VMAFREIENLIPMKKPADKTRMFQTLLKGQAMSYFEHHLMKRIEAEGSDLPDNELIKKVLRDVGSECCMMRGQSQFMIVIYFRLFLELDLVCQTGMKQDSNI
jgi:hypothetical protein